jgi:hypothetical protein
MVYDSHGTYRKSKFLKCSLPVLIPATNLFRNIVKLCESSQKNYIKISVPFRESSNCVVDFSEVSRLLHRRIGGAHHPVADVVADGVVEEDGVLRHHADGGAQ